MTITPLLEANAELTHNARTSDPIVLSSRVRLARNLTQFPFPGWAKESQKREVLRLAMEALPSIDTLSDGTQLKVEELCELEKLILVERHLISRELMGAKANAGVTISRDQSAAVMINEEDHLRIQVVRCGLALEQLWAVVTELDTAIEARLDYAFSPELGYLTACPTNLGTGLRASVMLHLPGLVLSNHMEKVVRMVNQVGIAVRGLFGEGSDASGSIFQISNQQTLGESEEAIIKRLGNILNAVIEQERNARAKLIEDKGPKIRDKIARARGILQNAQQISTEEAMNLLSLIRMAIDLGMLPEHLRQTVDRLLIETQPGHIQYAAEGEIESAQRDGFRATLLREEFSQLPPLNFKNPSNAL